MGGASSKAARRFPKSSPKPTWAGARTSTPGEMGEQMPRTNDFKASETRSEAIEEDSRDPHFLAKLNRLGPVTVDHNMRTYKPAADLARHVYETRRQSEVEARSQQTTHNRILAASLSDLLEECKSAASKADFEKLARRYDIDTTKLQSLVALVNNPTVDLGSVTRTLGEDGEEKISMKVTWSQTH